MTKRCLLIGNSRWHWATQKQGIWMFKHTEPQPKKLDEIKNCPMKWAAVGPFPKGGSLKPEDEIKIENIPIKKLAPWIGIDRALSGWSAFKQAKALNTHSSGLLIADAGTILSLTRISCNGEFEGGQLIAGLRLQLSAMANGAENLYESDLEMGNLERFPIETDEAMKRGSLQALVGTISEALKETNSSLWLCGGDSPIILEELKQLNINAFHRPNLVLEGMVNL